MTYNTGLNVNRIQDRFLFLRFSKGSQIHRESNPIRTDPLLGNQNLIETAQACCTSMLHKQTGDGYCRLVDYPKPKNKHSTVLKITIKITTQTDKAINTKQKRKASW